jgi:hypothetical protein
MPYLKCKVEQLIYKGELLPVWMLEFPWGGMRQLNESEYRMYFADPVQVVPKLKEMTLEEKVALALADRGVVPLDEVVVDPTAPVRYDEDAIIKSMGLQVPRDIPGVKINSEAGPDGSMMTVENAAQLSNLFVTTADKKVQIAVIKKFLPTSLHHLMKVAASMDKRLRLAIAMAASEQFGEAGRGNIVPAGWAEFVELERRGEASAIAESHTGTIVQPESTGGEGMEESSWERLFSMDALASKLS